MNLSQHFTLVEFIASDMAIRHKIDNYPAPAEIENLKRLAAVLEQARALLGFPIFITSGYRCSKLNKLVGSKPTSKHVAGLAADIKCPSFGTPRDVVEAIAASDINFDQCIMEFYNPGTGDGWCHIGLGAKPRRQVLTINSSGVDYKQLRNIQRGAGMNPLLPGGIFDIAKGVISRIWPDPAQQAEAQMKLLELQQSGELAKLVAETDLAKLQIQTNIEEAKSANVFIAGWRPMVGWVGAVAFGYATILEPVRHL